MEPTSADVIPKVILRESLKATGGTSKEQAARAIGQKLLDKSTPEEWRQAQESIKRKKPIEQKSIDRKLDEIGIERDNAGKKVLTKEEEERFDRADKAARLAKKVIEQGYDKTKFTPEEQAILSDAIRDKIRANPFLLTEFRSLTTDQKTAEIERRLKDPKFLADLSENVNGLLSPDKKLLDEQQIIDREIDVKEKEDKKTEEQAAIGEFTTKSANIDTALKEFDSSSVPPGIKSVELKTLLSASATVQAELMMWKDTLEEARAELSEANNDRQTLLSTRQDRTGTEAKIQTKKDEIKRAQKEVDSRQNKLDRIKQLQTEEASLKDKKIEAEKNIRTKDIDLKKADWELGKAQRRLDGLKREREYEEEDLASNLKNVFSETADKYIGDEIQAIESKVNAELEETKKKESDTNKKAMYDEMGKRWEGKINKKKAEEDFADLKVNGPEPLMKRLLQRVEVEDPIRHIKVRAYTDDQINALLLDKSDESYYKKMEPEVVMQLLSRKILSGGINTDDVNTILYAKWGGEGMIKKAMEKNKAASEEVEKIVGEKSANPGFMKKLWESGRKRPWIFVALFGLIGVPLLFMDKK